MENRQIKKAEEKLFRKHEEHLLARAKKVTLAKIRSNTPTLSHLDRQVLKISHLADKSLSHFRRAPVRPAVSSPAPTHPAGNGLSDDLDADLDSFFAREKQRAAAKAAKEAAARKAAAKEKAAKQWAEEKMRHAIQEEKERKMQEKKKEDRKFEEYRKKEERKIRAEEEKKEHDKKVDALIEDTIQQVVAGTSSPREKKPTDAAFAYGAGKEALTSSSLPPNAAHRQLTASSSITPAAMTHNGDSEMHANGTAAQAAKAPTSAPASVAAEKVLDKEVSAVAGGKTLGVGDLLGDLATIMSANTTSAPPAPPSRMMAQVQSGVRRATSRIAGVSAADEGQEERARAARHRVSRAPGRSNGASAEKSALHEAQEHQAKAALLEKRMKAVLARCAWSRV